MVVAHVLLDHVQQAAQDRLAQLVLAQDRIQHLAQVTIPNELAALIDTGALLAGLKSGQIGYAGLDVYEEESDYFFEDFSDRVMTDDLLARLTTFNNVLVTSHQAFLTSVVDEIGPLDIIIDDGSHLNEHVIRTFEILFPLLNEGGIYAVEDLQTSYWPDHGGSSFNLKI